MFDFISLDFALGLIAACALWVVGDWIYKRTRPASTSTSPAPASASVVANLESRVGQAMGQVGSALNALRNENQVKLSAVETALHERLTAVEATVFGADYSAATQAATAPAPAAPAAAAPATPAPAAPHPSKVPASHLAAVHHAAVAGTAVAGVQAQAGNGKLGA